MDRLLTFWGIGNVCETCLKWNKDVIPELFIDEKTKLTEFHGKRVVRSSNIKNWKEIFVVITVMNDNEIKRNLKNKGLVEELDFISYRDFFSSDIKVCESIERISKWIEQNETYRKATFIYAPMFICRQSTTMSYFFKSYIEGRKPKKSIIFSELDIMSEQKASEFMDAPIITTPRLCIYDSPRIDEKVEYDYYKNEQIELSKEEKEWIVQLESWKTSIDTKITLRLTEVLYQYIRDMFKLLEPNRVIIWGGWSRISHILAKIAENMGIPYGFMEYGWLPGTYQFDYYGIAGQNKYRLEKKDIPNNDDYSEIEQIKNYIKDRKIDTGHFNFSEFDEKQLSKINTHRKTVFFVGMGEDGMQINPCSIFWRKYVSNIVYSTHEAVEIVYNICKKNNWNFIFKPHPREDNFEGYNEWAKDKEFILVREMEIDRLIEISDVVVSISSAVEYKALIYEKALVQVGHGALEGLDCSYIPKSRSDIETTIRQAVNYGETDRQKKAFNQHLFNLLGTHLWSDLSQNDLSYGLSVKDDFFDKIEKIGEDEG